MLNRAELIGYIGNDLELRHTQSGNAVTNMRVATTEKFTRANGDKVERTEWHSIVMFGGLAETCAKYLNKGRQVYVEGRLQTRKWQDKDGNDRYTTEIVAQTVQFLGGTRKDKDEAPKSDDAPPPSTSSDQPDLDGAF